MDGQLGGLRQNYELSPLNREHLTHKMWTRSKYKRNEGSGYRKLKMRN
ncbi:hypothetical protein PC116_g19235 [Phytophthora cactorum]|nr:hypothetical protein PC114_g12553 [Phytophthora cactorum]KAG3149521.1 hypothetical protein C6341_g17019 [Phytophthora cactorum]KAG4232536.1 hypothetical protein PC116_g19235 [Phytophthora cactorum]